MIQQAIILAVMVEAIIETLKPLWDKKKAEDKEFMKDKIIVLVISMVITILVGVDFFSVVGLEILGWVTVPAWVSLVIGTFLSGIIVSRGANFVHDLFFKRIEELVKGFLERNK